MKRYCVINSKHYRNQSSIVLQFCEIEFYRILRLYLFFLSKPLIRIFECRARSFWRQMYFLVARATFTLSWRDARDDDTRVHDISACGKKRPAIYIRPRKWRERSDVAVYRLHVRSCVTSCISIVGSIYYLFSIARYQYRFDLNRFMINQLIISLFKITEHWNYICIHATHAMEREKYFFKLF